MRFFSVQNLRLSAPPSRLALIIGYYKGFLKVLNMHVLAPPSRLALIIGAWLALQGISKSVKFAGVGFVVKAGFDYRALPCIIG